MSELREAAQALVDVMALKGISGSVGDYADALRAALARDETERDAERLDWMQFHSAQVIWGNDDEFCRVTWSDRDGEVYRTDLFNDWRDAIDAARAKEG